MKTRIFFIIFFNLCSNQCYINRVYSQWSLWLFNITRNKHNQDSGKFQLKQWGTFATPLDKSPWRGKRYIYACVYRYICIYRQTHRCIYVCICIHRVKEEGVSWIWKLIAHPSENYLKSKTKMGGIYSASLAPFICLSRLCTTRNSSSFGPRKNLYHFLSQERPSEGCCHKGRKASFRISASFHLGFKIQNNDEYSTYFLSLSSALIHVSPVHDLYVS